MAGSKVGFVFDAPSSSISAAIVTGRWASRFLDEVRARVMPPGLGVSGDSVRPDGALPGRGLAAVSSGGTLGGAFAPFASAAARSSARASASAWSRSAAAALYAAFAGSASGAVEVTLDPQRRLSRCLVARLGEGLVDGIR